MQALLISALLVEIGLIFLATHLLISPTILIRLLLWIDSEYSKVYDEPHMQNKRLRPESFSLRPFTTDFSFGMVIFCLLQGSVLFAFEQPLLDRNQSQTLDVPILETPFNLDFSGAWPSMNQSMVISSAFYQAMHSSVDRGLQEKNTAPILRRLTLVGLDILTYELPLSAAWMHEEWHRAVMTRRHVGSHNDVYDLKLFSTLISVSHETDEDLSRMKAESPSDFVRMSSAGIESETVQNLYLEKDIYFNNSKTWNMGILWMNAVQNFSYIHMCNSKESTQTTQKQNDLDGTDISKRDFTGLDCLGWVYDLHRPDEPYQSRGIHPSGIGINRYRTLEDLTDREKTYLKTQEYLNLLNFADPFLFHIYRLGSEAGDKKETHSEFAWNFKLQHFLTSFGYDIDALLFLKNENNKYLITMHNYFNDTHYFSGISAEVIDFQVSRSLSLDLTLSLWFQPEKQKFETGMSQLGGLVESKFLFGEKESWRPYFFVRAKEQGWVAGVVDLDKAFAAGFGLTAKL